MYSRQKMLLTSESCYPLFRRIGDLTRRHQPILCNVVLDAVCIRSTAERSGTL